VQPQPGASLGVVSLTWSQSWPMIHRARIRLAEPGRGEPQMLGGEGAGLWLLAQRPATS
jgi:hypothetical protein